VIQYQETDTQGNQYTNTYTNTLVRFENYEISSEHGTSTVLQSGTTNYQYDVNGNLTGLTDTTNSVNNRSFVNDAAGQILQKTQGSSVERELIANGQLVGTTGTGTSPDAPGKGNQPNFVNLTNFDPTYKPINSNYPAPTPGAYTVNAGDSLESIAQGAYGDSKLWYLIADANGLSGDKDLRVGQTLNIPNQVGDVHNSAGDFRPYDASTVVGGTQPNLPQPPADSGGCGGILGIIVLVIVVVITAIAQQYYAVPEEAAAETGAGAAEASAATADAAGAGASAAGAGAAGAGSASLGASIATAAVTGAALDAATQLVGDVLGTHQGFDLLETVEAGSISALTAGMGGDFGSSYGGMALRGALQNAATQGVRLALHQQNSFNWMQVALSAAAAPAAQAVGNAAGNAVGGALSDAGASQFISAELGQFTTGMVSNTVTTLATGGKVSLASIATDAFGNALGQSLALNGNSGDNPFASQAQNQINVGNEGDAVMFGPLGDAAALPTGDGYTDAVYNQMVGAFSDAQGSYSSAPGVLLASNDIGDSGQLAATSDAGGDNNGYNYERSYMDANGVIQVQASRTPFDVGATSYGANYDGALSAWSGDDSANVDLNAAAFRSAANDVPGYDAAGNFGNVPSSDFELQRTQRIAALMTEAQIPEDVQDSGLNILVTGVGRTSPDDASALPGSLAAGGNSVMNETPLDAFIRGATGRGGGLLEPNPSVALTAGQYAGEAWQSLENFGHTMIGAGYQDEAIQQLHAGNYVEAFGHELQAFGQAGLTLMGVGEMTQAVAPAARAFAGSFSDVGARMVDSYVDQTGLRMSMVDNGGQNVGGVTESVTGPVQKLEVLTYGQSVDRAVVRDQLTGDHIPSYAAIRTSVEDVLDRPLTPDEATVLKNQTNVVVVDQDLHAAGRTFLYKNTPTQVASDSQNLANAASLDQAMHLQNAEQFGYNANQMRGSFDVLNQQNATLFDQLSTRRGIYDFFEQNGLRDY
jgi:LysM repeat protein